MFIIWWTIVIKCAKYLVQNYKAFSGRYLDFVSVQLKRGVIVWQVHRNLVKTPEEKLKKGYLKM